MLGRIGSVLAFWRVFRLAWCLLRDGRVPLRSKLVLPAGLLYMVFPLDLLPDFFPALGQLDDLTVMFLSVLLFVRLCPAQVVREHMESLSGRPRRPKGGEGDSGPIIDGEYEILE